MKFPINLQKVLFPSIVSVKCGTSRGTAFFVSSDTLITARHVVVDSLTGDEVIINANKEVLCEVESIGENEETIDVVLLRCKDYTHHTWLKLLSAIFNEERELTILGYPRELGNCSDLISIEVRDRIGTSRAAYDTMVVRTDSLAMNSYKGFSGSPVLNEKGSVIGVALQQISGNLGYCSIRNLVDKLEEHGIHPSIDWQSEDFTALGRGRSQRQVENAIKYASLRYHQELHVSNEYLDSYIDYFAIKSKRDSLVNELKKIESLALDPALGLPKFKYEVGNYEILFESLPSLNFMKDKKLDTPAINTFYQDEVSRLQDLTFALSISNHQYLTITAKAGMGKTHYVCATATRLAKQMHVYLLFGSKFSNDIDFEFQLQAMMNIDAKTLGELNEEMANQDTNGLIIIDAINEGASESFWKRALSQLESTLYSLTNLKLIVTFRKDDGNYSDIFAKHSIELQGFKHKIDFAINKYFKHYKLEDMEGRVAKRFRNEFNEPLFLNIFCTVSKYDHRYMYEDFTYSELFREYIKYRNEVVSLGVDEDCYRNVTQKLLDKVASYALYYANCSDIPREKARVYADQICRFRTWSNSLLYWVIKENLLLTTGRNNKSLMFGYQKMGDFLIADIFSQNKMSDENKIDFIVEKSKLPAQTAYRRFIIALLSDWDLTPDLLKKDILKNKNLVNNVLASITYHGKNNIVVFDWMKKNGVYNLDILYTFFNELPNDIFYDFHDRLMKYNLADRDKRWTVQVNEKYKPYWQTSFSEYIDINLFTGEHKKYLILLGWMCTSTHPAIRGVLLRKLVALFEKHSKLVLYAIKMFHECNDSYVVQSITCAVYGHLLRNRDSNLCSKVAELILKCFYKGDQSPRDILVRQWTLLSLQFADYLNGDNTFMKIIKQPFTSENPFDIIIDGAKEDKTYFGNSEGAIRMYETLYGFSDFNRYIIGTNHRKSSNVFYKYENGKLQNMSLSTIKDMIAYVVKRDLGWDDDLGELDKGSYSSGRYNNNTERFGKKYLWLALYKIDALLCDHCKVVDGSRYIYQPTIENCEVVPMPWHTREYSTIDPTILMENIPVPFTFNVDSLEKVEHVNNDEWIAPEYPLPNARLKILDENDKEWIVLTCYDGHKTKGENKTIKDLFLYSNAAFIKKSELEQYIGWAKEQNFYGRWMPEWRNGSTDYIWNEYPWADTYKRTQRDIENYNNNFQGKPFTLYLSYESQLQENWMGLDENKAMLRQVYMPNHQMMEFLGLYTAERGVIKEIVSKEIVATHFRIEEMNGLVIRKEYLNKYLEANDYILVYYSLGEKHVRQDGNYTSIGKRHNLSGAYFYNKDGIAIIQPMRITESL